jgi:tetratricopeptide (TPR) repeat protein
LALGREGADLSDMSEIHSKLGDTYAAKEEWRRAVEHYESARVYCVEQGDDTGIAYNLMGMASVYEKLGEVDHEIESYQQALAAVKQLPSYPQAYGWIYIGLAQAYRKKHEWDLAIECCESARAAFEQKMDVEDLISAYRNLGWTYVDKGNDRQAIESFEHATSCVKRIGDIQQLSDLESVIQFLSARLVAEE